MANILVVEDDRSMRLLTSARLSDTYNVICACNGSRELLQHLWLNLLSNAIKYTPSGGEIALTLRREDENAVVTVRDTGEGMSERTQKNLFTPYYQGDPSRSRQGLGIAISKRIVELSGGTIEVTSELGRGSEFKVGLPLRGR